jgi:hypothetical protein
VPNASPAWPRPLPFLQTSDPIFTIDLEASLRWSAFEIALAAKNVLDTRYALGESNFASDWHTGGDPSSPTRHVSAGAPRYLSMTLGVTLGGGSDEE